jgi:glutathione synthase/RimK-type ligase-like ATP-grasp enzyme/ribosomal protein S18 acetylase RimI-like enzyme
MNLTIRRSSLSDLDLLLRIEEDAFPVWQQSSRRVLRHSLLSPSQEVFIGEVTQNRKKLPVGCLVLHLYKRTLRIFSIAVFKEFKGKGLGTELLRYAENYARSHGFQKLSLEAQADNKPLIKWYKAHGFETTELIDDYYAYTIPALRMVKKLVDAPGKRSISNVVVVDHPKDWDMGSLGLKVISALQYTSDEEFYSKQNLRVFNLCRSYKYQSIGYYVSLLANARGHRAIPSVTTMRDASDLRMIKSVTSEIEELIRKVLSKSEENRVVLNIYFGISRESRFSRIAQKLFQIFEIPFFKLILVKQKEWEIHRIEPISLEKSPPEDSDFIQQAALKFFSQQRFFKKKLKDYQYDLGILINTIEEYPPSDIKALQLFREAAEQEGFYVEFIEKGDFNRLSEFDALFIRETTSVNDHTYQFSRKAYAEGLVVIDDPWSVLKCSNKIYLEERLRTNAIPTPHTQILYKGQIKKKVLKLLKYPLILKQPDSAFSRGVIKVQNEEELRSELNELFRKSDLVIAQYFMPSDFDWRIGVLDNQPLFACKYYMAKGHWQIYDWKSKETDPTGDAETVPVDLVPKKIMDTALKAASLMGDGLYGVDLKEFNGKVFVIEVNDNPNIDFGIEDEVLGKRLYLRIMQSLKTRIEMSRNISRFVSVESTN